MLKKSCSPTSVSARRLALLVAFALLMVGPVFADQKDDNFKAAQAAANASRIEDAAKLFCGVAQQDPGYRNGEAAQNCKIYQDQVNRENARNEERYTDGIRMFNNGQLDDAEAKFRAIHSGPHLASAQEYLNSKIPSAKTNAQAAGAEAAMDAKFNSGVEAYNNNAFNNARTYFSAVTGGKHQAEAQGYISKMQQYDAAMQQGKSQLDGKNFKGAIDAFAQAANIKADGPGDPNDKISTAKMMAGAGGGGTPPPPVKPAVIEAVVEPSRPKLDLAKLMKEAQAAEKKGDYGQARGKYLAILTQDENNAAARGALNALPKDTGGNQQKAGSEADVALARAIGEFYSGKYDVAEVHIGDYLSINGGKSALGYFYRGVSKLTRYYLHGEQPGEKNLMTDAQEDFKKAKGSSGFNPPEQMVSPKIMEIYKSAS